MHDDRATTEHSSESRTRAPLAAKIAPWIFPAIAFLGCSAASSGPSEPTSEIGNAIVGGTTDSVHTGVGLFWYDDGVHFEQCTGTLIAPNIVLTAAHCVFGAIVNGVPAEGAAGNMHFLVGPGQLGGVLPPNGNYDPLNDPAFTSYAVTGVVPNPSFTNHASPNLDDAALVYLYGSVAGADTYSMATQEPAVGAIATAVGYGNETSASVAVVGIRESANSEVTSTSAELYDSIQTVAAPGAGGGYGTKGDSGGPLFVNGAIVAIDMCPATSTNSELYTPILAVSAWIQSVVAQSVCEDALGGVQCGTYTDPLGARVSCGTCSSSDTCSSGHCCPTGTTWNNALRNCYAKCTSKVCPG